MILASLLSLAFCCFTSFIDQYLYLFFMLCATIFSLLPISLFFIFLSIQTSLNVDTMRHWSFVLLLSA